MTASHRGRLDELEIAWAAGFFDGEGSTIARRDSSRPAYRRLEAIVPQSGGAVPPEVLRRFQRAVLGLGSIGPRDSDGMYKWRNSGRMEAETVINLLWEHLGGAKRHQATRALHAVLEQYSTGRVRRGKARSPATCPDRLAMQWPRADRSQLEVAWAAGFIDAEGWFGLSKKGVRSDGTQWYRIRTSVSQHGTIGSPPETLVRLQAALGGIGHIERHGEPDDYKWLAEGAPAMQRVLGMLGSQLGSAKQSQARGALARFASLPRNRGDRERCKRGHTYDTRVTRNGVRGAVCRTCERLMERRRRAAQGIAPRAFKDVSRRYTE